MTAVLTAKQQSRELQERQRAQKAELGLSTTAVKVLIVRHGETDWNAEHRLQGQQDPPLNAQGRRQADALVLRLQNSGFSGRIFSSDLSRALQTAECVSRTATGDGPQVESSPAFRERSLGVLEGLTAAESRQQRPVAWQLLQSCDPTICVPGGESAGDVQRRASAGLAAIAQQHPGETVLVVTHGGVLQAVYRHVRGHEYKGKFLNCALNTLFIDGDKWTLGVWNDIAHLNGVGAQKEAFGGGRAG